MVSLYKQTDTHTNQTEFIMTKLINTFRACPSPANRAKLQNYLVKHMMASCMATPDEIAFLKAHEFKA